MQTSETEVREMLWRRANEFSMDAELPSTVVRRGHRRRLKKVTLGTATLGSVAVAVALIIGSIGAPTAPDDAVEAGSGPSQASLKLVSYLIPDTRIGEPGGNASEELHDHVACMRAQGFDIPDPVQTPDGWTITVDPR